jgi:ribosomal protein L37E
MKTKEIQSEKSEQSGKYKILSNQIECLQCGDKPYSAHRHHMSHCKCGAVAVDGGMSYLRRVGSNYKDISIMVDEDIFNDCLKSLKWATDTNRNDLGRLCALFRVFRDHGCRLQED